MTKSSEQKTPTIKLSITNIAIRKSLNLFLIVLLTDIIQSGQESFTATDGQTAYPLTGSPVLPAFSQVWVFRNGAKLVANVDYTVAGSTVTLDTSAAAPNDWAVLAGDVIEVQFVK